MTFLGVREVRLDLSGFIEKAQRKPIVVMYHNRPKAVLMAYDESLERASSEKVGSERAHNEFSAFLASAQNSPVVITYHGKPRAMLLGVDGKSIEQVLKIYGKAS